MKTEIIEKKKLTLSVKDVEELLPGEKFEYKMYWDYSDEIDQSMLEKHMPDIEKYKTENWYDYASFVNDWKINLEDDIWDMNIDWITEEIDKELTEEVEKKLKEKWIKYDYLEFDFYPDEIYSIDLDLDYILKRSKVVWNVIRCNNYDGFWEGETYEDWEGLKELVDLYPELVKKEDLEKAVNDGMYTWSDLKVNFRHSMEDFFDILATWRVDLSGCTAVLHLWMNGSGSTEFELWKWCVELWKQAWSTEYDRWDWWFDWKYWIHDVYGCIMNDCY